MEAVNALYQRSLILPTGAQNPTPRIVEDGTTSTILVYGTGGALIASIASVAGTDGLGNNYPAGISATAGVISQSIILLYNGTPALGNLIMSMAAAAGADSFGNAYIAGLGTYAAGVNTYQLTASTGDLRVGTAAAAHWLFDVANARQSLFDQNNALTARLSAFSTNSNFVWLFNSALQYFALNSGIQLGSLSVAGALPTAQDQSNSSGLGLTLGSTPSLAISSPRNTTGTGSHQSLVSITSGSPGDTAPGSINNGTVIIQSFTAGSFVDIGLAGAIYRQDLSGWQLPTVPANWTRTGFATELGLQYRIDSMDNLFIAGAVRYTGAGLPAGTNTTLFTLPAAYRPLAGTRRPTYQSTGNGVFGWAVVQSGGAVIVSNPTALVTNDVIEFEITCPMGNLP